jgi:PEP-CTERM motif
MTSVRLSAAAVFLAATVAAAPAAATVGSASFATQRSCATTAATADCNGMFPGQSITLGQYGGGIGVGGLNRLVDGDNRAWSDISFDASLDLPEIKAYTVASGNVRMNINAFAFQSYVWNGADGDFSITGDLHIVDSSTSPDGGARPGGAVYTAYVGIWDPSVLVGLTTPQQLFSALFVRSCGQAGVLGAGVSGGTLTGGEASYLATTSACAPGLLTLTAGQEVLVVTGLQLPVNRGGFANSSATFATRLGDDLAPEQKLAIEQSVLSAIAQGAPVAGVPEPSSWALLVAGFGLAGAALRRRRAMPA